MPAGYGWSFPAGDEVRVGVGSFDPRFHVKEPTVDARRATCGATPVRYQGNWIPHKLRAATEDGVFFAGDSAGHCLPLTAEGIRTAFYFGIALRARAARGARGPRDARDALRRYAAFSASTSGSSAGCCARSARAARAAARAGARERAMATRAFTHWAFGHYLKIAPPEFARAAAALRASRRWPPERSR